jgi:hypothetical protein
MLLIGSKALVYHFPFLEKTRKINDIDIIASFDEIKEFIKNNKNIVKSYKFNNSNTKLKLKTKHKNVECEILDGTKSSRLFYELNKNNNEKISLFNSEFIVANKQTLYLLKKSHVGFAIHWQKNINDYHFLKNNFNINNIDGKYYEAYNARLNEISERVKQNKINLNQTNSEFFNKSEKIIKRIYEHDDIHKIVAYYDTPMYERVKQDKDKAYIPKNNFDNLSLDDKIKMAREECYAIALERKIIPIIENNGTFDEKKSFQYAIQRICTTLTSGFFKEFVIENYPLIINYDKDFSTIFIESVLNNKIKKKNEQ